jgi:hypothetical protein
MKVDAEAVDAAVLEDLPRLMPRFNKWIPQIEDRHAAERDLLKQARNQAAAERDAQRRKLEAAEDRWLALSPEDQEVVLGALHRGRRGLSDAETRLTATEGALASIPEDVSHDRLLDFASTLRGVIGGKLDGDRTVGELNRALGELFASFTICRELPEDTLREEVDDALRSVGSPIYVFPNLRREIAWRLVAEYDESAESPAPPREWIEALALSANSQE